jgi:hypothetical protein
MVSFLRFFSQGLKSLREKLRRWVGPGFSPDIILKTHRPSGLELRFSLHAYAEIKGNPYLRA